eukprot:1569367-Rhodomonas_salina.7
MLPDLGGCEFAGPNLDEDGKASEGEEERKTEEGGDKGTARVAGIKTGIRPKRGTAGNAGRFSEQDRNTDIPQSTELGNRVRGTKEGVCTGRPSS